MRSIFNYFTVWSGVAGLACGACSENLNISASEQVSAIASCATYTGTISILPPASTIALEGVTEIVGSIEVEDNSDIITLSSSSILAISDSLWLVEAHDITTINFPKLHSIGDLVSLTTPLLENIGFNVGVNVSNVSMTGPFSFQKMNLNINSADSVKLYWLQMEELSLPLQSVGHLSVSSLSGIDGFNKIIEFPNLTSAGDILCNSNIEVSMPKLSFVKSSLIYETSSTTKLELPKLTLVKGSFQVTDTTLQEISMPALLNVSEILVKGNPNLTSLKFGNLSTVAQIVTLEGPMGEYVMHSECISMPNLKFVGGDFYIITTNISLNCNAFDAYKQNGLIKGSYDCNGSHVLLSPLSTSAQFIPSQLPTGPPATPPHLSSRKKAGIGFGVSIAAVSLISVTLAILLRRKGQRKSSRSDSSAYAKPEVGGKGILPEEMASGKNAHELQAEHGHTEVDENAVRVVEGTHEMAS